MDNNWTVSLEQSGELETTRGTSIATAEALRRGADLRVFLIAQGYEETLYFQQTYVGEGDRFAGLMTHHHSYAHRGSLAEQPYFSCSRHLAEPGRLPFRRSCVQRGMQWLTADD
ncbi:MAG: hypothetical protein QGG36_26455 [Pirellulaceae bacterium]|jgi:hypothetical protein|nr:hypothetical protein [Pirellulaceae bacterium]MDP7019367.1 hypothetical protein [Pirellulaceae bacterium]